MLFLLFILAIIALILLLIYDYIKVKRERSHWQKLLTNTQTALSSSQTVDQQLAKEVTELQGKLDRLVEDPVTHLLGLQLFEDRLTQNIKESARYQFTMGVLFVDIDDFKVINDALSYEVGNALLVEVAKRLQACIRQVDSISRFSKDTFVILLTQLAKPETAAVVAQRILQSLTPAFSINGRELYITVGIGIAIYPTDGQDSASLLRSADHALHLAKEKGKHAYQFYQEKLHERSQRELTLYTNISRETSLNEFLIYYQPIVNVQTDEVVCMDALLHWQQPTFGLIQPDEIYMLSERQRKLNQLTEWLLKNACTQFVHWSSLGFHPQLLGIPLSVQQLQNTHFIYRISQILQEAECKPTCIVLEIRESAAQISFEILEKAFNMLKYLDVKIAIDNFGTGAFSLVNLKNFSINYLKLDASLIQDILTNTQTVALVKSILFMAQSLNLEVIVQGVETEEQSALLKNLGCILMEGSFISVALSEQEVVTKMVTLME